MEFQEIDEEKKNSIKELIIDLVRSEPIIFDKSLEDYHKEYRQNRPKIFEQISQAIFQVYEVNMSSKQINSMWNGLVMKFEKEHKNMTKVLPSGSGKKEIIKWQFYDIMTFMVPHINHRQAISSISKDSQDSFKKDDNTRSLSQNHNNYKHLEKKQKVSDITFLQNLQDDNKKILKSLNEALAAESKDNIKKDKIKKFMKIVETNFNLVSEENKISCVNNILSYISDFTKV